MSKTEIEKIGNSDSRKKVDFLFVEFQKIVGRAPVERVRWLKFMKDKNLICCIGCFNQNGTFWVGVSLPLKDVRSKLPGYKVEDHMKSAGGRGKIRIPTTASQSDLQKIVSLANEAYAYRGHVRHD